MGRSIERDLKRFKKIGEDSRMDLTDFIKHGSMGGDIKIPIKIIDLPSFEYDNRHKGGIGRGDADQGDVVDADNEGDNEQGDPGDGEEEHGYYEMDPEEFARELDEELGLEFEQKGQKVVETAEGAFNETRRSGPNSTLDTEHLFKEAIKRHTAMYFDEEYIKDMLRVRGYGIEKVWNWCRSNNITVSKSKVKELSQEIDNPTKYDSEDEINRRLTRRPPRSSYSNLKFRSDDEQYRAPEVVKKPQNNAVVINIRDVSGSMRTEKRELIERTFTPIDWYLQGKYDNVDFIYIAHDSKAWEVNRQEFFGIRSGGGTKVSSAYNLMIEEVLSDYPWVSWNRFVFAGGDGENKKRDTEDNLIPMMKKVKANRQAYIEVQPGKKRSRYANIAKKLDNEFEEDEQYRVSRVKDKDDILDSIRSILDTTKQNGE